MFGIFYNSMVQQAFCLAGKTSGRDRVPEKDRSVRCEAFWQQRQSDAVQTSSAAGAFHRPSPAGDSERADIPANCSWIFGHQSHHSGTDC